MRRWKEVRSEVESFARGKRFQTGLRPIGGVCAALCAGLLGCATLGDGKEGEGGVLGTSSEAIGTPGMVDSGTDAWRTWGPRPTATVVDSDPALCSNLGAGFFIVTRNSDLRYYVQMTFAATNPNWKQFGFRQFVSSPSCVFQQPFFDLDPMNQPSNELFVMAGKSTDNRIYVLEGVLVPGGMDFPNNPDWTGPWAQMSGTQYSGTNGQPALGSNRTRVVVTFLNNNRLHAHSQALPYVNTATAWGSRIDGPTLPTGVTASGVPAIVWAGGGTNRFVVMVRGVSSAGASLYWVYFNGTQFLGNFTQLTTAVVPDSDPSLEWDGMNDTITVYIRTGDKVTQTSAHRVEDLNSYPFHLVDEPAENMIVLGAPRAVFGASVEPNGLRGVVARGYDEDLATEENRNMFVMHAQDLVLQALQCESGVVDPIWSESDVDCGGDLCVPCEDGQICNVDPDCESRNCDGGICSPAPPPQTPCAQYCTNPVSISWNPSADYQSGGLGTGTTCREVTQFFDGLWCGNFVSGKQLIINGTAMNCTGSNLTAPPPQNGGYCIQSTAGNHSYAAYALWDTTQGQTPL
jgi:hypothetical protein